MPVAETYFSPDYRTARCRFRGAVEGRGGHLISLKLEARGPDDSELTIDLGWFGSLRPRDLLVVSSGLHGVEGFAGSATQLQFLHHLQPPPSNGAVLLVHCLNPYGMAWLRRVNESNVDLNRNFLGPDDTYAGAPTEYQRLGPLLNPTTPPSRDFFLPRAIWEVARHGIAPLKQAIAGGQYDYPRGLFFGGSRLEEGPRLVQDFALEYTSTADRLVAIDVHTGLGKFGNDVLLVDEERVSELRGLFGERVTPLEPGQGPAYRIRGGYRSMLRRAASRARVYFASQEFGTYRALPMLRALREENRWHQYGSQTVGHPAKQRLKAAFNPDDERWRKRVLARSAAVFAHATDLAFGGT